MLDYLDQSHPEMILATPWNDSLFLYCPIGGGEDGLDYYLRGIVLFTKTDYPDFQKEWQLLIKVRQGGI